MTEAAYDHMLQLSATLADGLKQRIARRALPWHVTSVGARSELIFERHRRERRENHWLHRSPRWSACCISICSIAACWSRRFTT